MIRRTSQRLPDCQLDDAQDVGVLHSGIIVSLAAEYMSRSLASEEVWYKLESFFLPIARLF